MMREENEVSNEVPIMSKRSCFVIMPIGDQEYAGHKVTAAELRLRYDDLIKEALIRADASLEIVRADDVAMPGVITSDILTRLMHSDLVIADVTFPNPNVFYELGLRHACRTGTIIIRDKSGPRVPFDIAHLRHIEYDNSATGLKKLAEDLRTYIEHLTRNPQQTDNQFQELAKLTHYEFPEYAEPVNDDPETAAFLAMMQSPEVLGILARQAAGEKVDQLELMTAMTSNPQLMGPMIKALVSSGQLALPSGQSVPQKLGNNQQALAKRGRQSKKRPNR